MENDMCVYARGLLGRLNDVSSNIQQSSSQSTGSGTHLKLNFFRVEFSELRNHHPCRYDCDYGVYGNDQPKEIK